MQRLEHIGGLYGLAVGLFVGGVGEVGDEDCGGFCEGEDGVALDGGVGGEDAFGEALNYGAGEEEILFSGRGEVSGLVL